MRSPGGLGGAWCSNEHGRKFSFHRYFAFFFALRIIIVCIAAAGIGSKRMSRASQRKVYDSVTDPDNLLCRDLQYA